jgi:hypothetical protein
MSPLVRHPPGQHTPRCSSPDNCLEYRDMLSETPTQTARRCAEQTASMLRTATAGQVFRISQPRPEVRKTASEWRDDLGKRLQGYGSVQPDPPPNPYGEVTKQTPCPHDDKNYNPWSTPPDPYQIALDRLKKETTP